MVGYVQLHIIAFGCFILKLLFKLCVVFLMCINIDIIYMAL